MEVGPW